MIDVLLANLWFLPLVLLGGFTSGLLAGLLGIGGGVVMMPLLIQLFGMMGVDEALRVHLAVGTSMATIIPTGTISAAGHYKRGGVNFTILRRWLPCILLGVAAGTVIGGRVTSDTLSAVFGFGIFLIALGMLLRRDGYCVSDSLPRFPLGAVLPVAVGAFSAMIGIGGGMLSVPFLTAFGVTVRHAVATAAAIGPVIAVPSTIGWVMSGWGQPGLPFGSLGYVHLPAFACVIPMSMTAAPLGSKIAHSIPAASLRTVFIGFLLFVAGERIVAVVL
jgi:uncharacterized membrane protein YfcA